MGDQDQEQQDQQGQSDQADTQTPPADGTQTQTDGQSGGGTQSGDGGGDGGSTQQQTQTPGVTAGVYRLSLTETQRKKLTDEGVLELSDEQYTGGVRHQVETLRKRASQAEKKLSDIAAAQAEADRKALEEQHRYQELYEQERQARETERAAHRDDVVRSRFLLAAQAKGFVDPEGAFVLAKSQSGFSAVTVDDAGAVSGLDALIETLSKEKPYLIASAEKPKPQSVGSPSNPGPQTPPAPKSLAEAGDRLEQALRSGTI